MIKYNFTVPWYVGGIGGDLAQPDKACITSLLLQYRGVLLPCNIVLRSSPYRSKGCTALTPYYRITRYFVTRGILYPSPKIALHFEPLDTKM